MYRSSVVERNVMPERKKRGNTGLLVAQELARASKPLSAYDLLERLRPIGVFAPTTVYRALEKLLTAGRVHRIESLNAFVACRASEADAHAHDRLATGFTICDNCGVVSEFVDPSLQARIEGAAAAESFRPSSVVEIHGRCAACAEASEG